MTARQQWSIVAIIVLVLGGALFAASHLLGDQLYPVSVGSKAPPFRAVTVDSIPRTHTRSRERTTEIDEIVARSNAMARRQSTTLSLPGKVGKQKSELLNLVLDKISERGIESLSGDERRLLEEMSKQLRSD